MDNVSLRDFIERRETEVRQRIAELRMELQELRIAREALEASPVRVASISNRGRGSHATESKSESTIKSMILIVLSEHQEGGDANRVVEWIKSRFQRDVLRSSVSPQLTRLRDEGRIRHDPTANLWLPVEKLEKSVEQTPQMHFEAVDADAASADVVAEAETTGGEAIE